MAKITKDEIEIRRWAARFGAHPVERAPFRPDGEPAQLAFVFGQTPEAGESLRPIPWERFFAIFHLIGLVLAYDDGHQYELLKLEEHESPRFEGKPMVA